MDKEIKTLKEYLEEIEVKAGDERGFIIIVGNVEMNVSRRYLESEPMKHYLDKKILDIYVRKSPEEEKIVFTLEEDSKL